MSGQEYSSAENIAEQVQLGNVESAYVDLMRQEPHALAAVERVIDEKRMQKLQQVDLWSLSLYSLGREMTAYVGTLYRLAMEDNWADMLAYFGTPEAKLYTGLWVLALLAIWVLLLGGA